MLSASETGAGSNVSEPTDKSTENVSERLAQERSSGSHRLKPSSSSSCDMSECSSSCYRPAPQNDDFRVCSYFGSSEPVLPRLPHFSRNLISTVSESFSELRRNQKAALSFSLMQGDITPQPFGATSSTLMEPFVTGALCSSEHSPDTYPLSSFSPQSDSLEPYTATAPLPELYISESETQDLRILSPHKHPREFQWPEYRQGEAGGKDADCDTHFPMCDSDNEVTRCHLRRAMPGCESDVSERARPPAAGAPEQGPVLVNDERRGNARPTESTPRPQQSPGPVELWLDACQYLAGEDAEDVNVLDRTRYSATQAGPAGDLSFPPGETKVSGCNLDGGEGIGWSDDDAVGWGPPVERWSSVDSWATALSDWTGIIAGPPEDFAAAFTEIGAEIDALTQALAEVSTHLETQPPGEAKGQEAAVRAQSQPPMGVQDQPSEARNPTGDGERCQSVESLCDSTAGAQEEKESEEIRSDQAERLRSPGGTVASPGGRGAGVVPGSTSSTDLNPSPLVGFVDQDRIFNSRVDSILLNIVEDTDLEGRDTPGDLMIEKPFGDEVREVTHGVCQLRWSTEQEVKRSRGPTEVDREGTQPRADPRFHTTRASGATSPGVHTDAGSLTNGGAHASSDTLAALGEACQAESPWASPEFVMPLAPLGILALAPQVCRTSRSLEGDQTRAKRSLNDNRDPSCDRMQARAHRPTPEGITGIKSLNGDEPIRGKGNKIKYTEKSSKEGQVDLIPASKTTSEELRELRGELSNPADPFFVSQKNRVAFITLDLNDPFVSRAAKPIAKGNQSDSNQTKAEKMPRKTHKSTAESKARSKKDKTAGHYHGTQACKKQEALSQHVSAQQVCKEQETHPLAGGSHTGEITQGGPVDKEAKLVFDAGATTEKAPSKPHGKKKKKSTGLNGDPPLEAENGAKPKTAKGRIEMFEAKLGAKAQKDSDRSEEKILSQQPGAKAEKPQLHADRKDHQPKKFTSPLSDDVIKRRRLSEDKFGKAVAVLESKFSKPVVSVPTKGEQPKVNAGSTRKKAFGEAVKLKIPPKEGKSPHDQNRRPVSAEPKAVQPIQAAPVSGDPRSLRLWCQFTAVAYQCTVTWSRGGAVLSESRRSAGDESRVSLTISNASHKDLGKYQCQLTSSHGSVSLDHLLTYEAAPVEDGSEEEDVHCSKLIFKEDFLSNQHFGENQPASIITEKVHFGEGMHRRAFRTKMQSGQIPLLLPGHPCVLKVHNSISYGTKNNDELVQKNFSLAVEECHVQNTAREYIKGYTTAAQSVEAFGEVPEVIPIYLVHRPSNDIPYATLEEELVGDFVKYSVKDGKEVNTKRRDSEAGQKCCAFQHWVFHKTEGNLLVTDMQGVGMRLTDVGIATCKKGYKGFKGNCATSFIDQFKALHQCNVYCELLGLKSLQPKPKKPASAPKPKPPPQSAAAKKKTSGGPTAKGKS